MNRIKAAVVVFMVFMTSTVYAQESFKNRWWPNGDPIPGSVAPLQSTVTTTITTPDKTITTTTSTPWGSLTLQPIPPAVTTPAVPPAQPLQPPILQAPAVPQLPKLQPQIVPKASPTNDIYAIVICMYYVKPDWQSANGCRFPENGMALFRSEDECKQSADMANRGNPFHQGDNSRRVEKCYKRTVNSWTSTE